MRVIEFYYHGSWRTAEPFCLGIVIYGRADNESLLCWQTAGADDLNEERGWRLYRASEIEEITIGRERFTGDRPNYHPAGLDFAKIICCVDFEGRVGTGVIAAPEVTAPQPVYAAAQRHVPVVLTHNQLMACFHTAHPFSLLQKYEAISPGATLRSLPERLKSKNRPAVPLGNDSPLVRRAA